MNFASLFVIATIFLTLGIILMIRGKATPNMHATGIYLLVLGVSGSLFFMISFIIFILFP